MDDAVSRSAEPVTHERLHGWQAALFPTGYSGMTKIRAGSYRVHEEPMQIVGGRAGGVQVHYEAPASAHVPAEMERLLQWFNAGTEPDILVRAAVTHLWFQTVHPFEDGNGRVGRIWVHLALARDSGDAGRLIRMSQRFLERRNEYYDRLKDAQYGALDVTRWVIWFVQQIQAACEEASGVIDKKLAKVRFWMTYSDKTLNERQRKVLNLLLDSGPDGFEGGMSTRKYESIAKTSRATASRELIQLEAFGLLEQSGAGRSTRYRVKAA